MAPVGSPGPGASGGAGVRRRRAGAFCRLALAALAGLPAGCKGVQRVLEPPAERPAQNPFPFRKLAVLPFVNLSGETSPAAERVMAKAWVMLAEELGRVRGLEVVPPGAVTRAMERLGGTVRSPQEALAVARAVDADAVLVGAVTSYDPYYRPRVGLALQVYERFPRGAAAPDILALAERGRPFRIRRGNAPAAVLDRIYDSSERSVDLALRAYAGRRAFASPLGLDRYLRDMEKYLAFVCHQAVSDLVGAERKRREAAAAPEPPRSGAPPPPAEGGRLQ